MNKKDLLIKAITKQIKLLENVEIKNQYEAQFLEEFLNAYDINNIDSYKNINNSAYLTSILIAENIDIPFSELLELIDNIQEFVNKIDFELSKYKIYLQSLKRLYDLGIIDKVKNSKEIKNFKDEEKIAYKIYKALDEDLFSYENENDELIYLSKDSKNFVKLFEILPDPSKYNCIADINFITEMITPVFETQFNDMLDKLALDELNISEKRKMDKIIEKERKKLGAQILNDFIDNGMIPNVKKDYKHLQDYSNLLQKQVKEQVCDINKKLKKLQIFMNKLDFISENTIIKIKDYNDFLFDFKIRDLFIDFAFEHNFHIYKATEVKNKEYKNNNINKFEILFAKYGFNFNNLFNDEQEAIIKANENKNIEDMLAVIKYSDLSFLNEYHKEFTRLLLDADINVIKEIVNLLKNKIINKNFIMNNIEVLFDKEKYINLLKNINLLTSNEVNLSNAAKINYQLLMINNNDLNFIFNILNEYNFNLTNDNNFEILFNSDLLDIIDNFIELGMYSVVKENQKYLNSKSGNIIKRILISNLIGINPVNSYNKLVGQVTTGNKFYVNVDKYDNYIVHEEECYLNPNIINILENNKRLTISNEVKNSGIINILDKLYQKNKLVYEINGVIISRNRVLRNLGVLLKNDDVNENITDILYQAIIYKIVGNIDDDKLIEIYNSLKSMEKNKCYKK